MTTTPTTYTYERPDNVFWVATVDPISGDEVHRRITPNAKGSRPLRPDETTRYVKNTKPRPTEYKPVNFDGLTGTAQCLLGLLFSNPVRSVEQGINFLSASQSYGATPDEIRMAAERYVEALPDVTKDDSPKAMLGRMVAFLKVRKPQSGTAAIQELAGPFSGCPVEQRNAAIAVWLQALMEPSGEVQ
jgi:hypothetical protein